MPYFVISACILLLDQWSKNYMTELLELCVPGRCESIVILPVFQLTLLHNDGAAFSFLSDAGGWQRWFLLAISTGVSLFIAVWLARVWKQQRLLSLALCLILGGAIGNLVDRAVEGYVVDFLVFHYGQSYFPAFNVADTAISIGAALLILDMLIGRQPDKENL